MIVEQKDTGQKDIVFYVFTIYKVNAHIRFYALLECLSNILV